MKTNRDFICLSYKYTDYLIEKDAISGSLYFEQKKNTSLSRETEILGKNATVVNLDFLIKQAFWDSGVSQESMVIKVGEKYIETSAQAFVKSISLSEFKMFGSVMDKFFQKRGLVAIRYIEENRVQYLLDINTFINTFEVGNK